MLLDNSDREENINEKKSDVLAEKLRENWLSKQSDRTQNINSDLSVNSAPTNSERDDSLTSLNWLQSLNLTKLPSEKSSTPMTQHPYYAQYYYRMQQQMNSQLRSPNLVYSHQRHVYHTPRANPLNNTTKSTKIRMSTFLQQQKIRCDIPPTLGCISLPFLLPKPCSNTDVLSNQNNPLNEVTTTTHNPSLGSISIITNPNNISGEISDVIFQNLPHNSSLSSYKRRKMISTSSSLTLSPTSTGFGSRSNSAGSSSHNEYSQNNQFIVFDSIEPDERKSYRLDPHIRPAFSYTLLMFMAFDAIGKPKVSLKNLCKWICENFAFYRYSDPAWQNAMRQCLGHSSSFQRVPKRKDEHDGGWNDLWRLSPEMQELAVRLHEQAVTTTTQSSGSNTPANTGNVSPHGSSGICCSTDESQQAVDQLTRNGMCEGTESRIGWTLDTNPDEGEVDDFLKAVSSIDDSDFRMNPNIDRANTTLTANQWTLNAANDRLSESMTNFLHHAATCIQNQQNGLMTKYSQVDGNNNMEASGIIGNVINNNYRFDTSLSRGAFLGGSPPSTLAAGIIGEMDDQTAPWVDDQLNLDELDTLLGLNSN